MSSDPSRPTQPKEDDRPEWRVLEKYRKNRSRFRPIYTPRSRSRNLGLYPFLTTGLNWGELL